MIFFNAPNIKDITYKDQRLEMHWGLSRLNPRFRKAQIWLDEEIMRDMGPVVPYRTGVFLRTIEAVNRIHVGTGRITTSVPPQGRYLYGGIAPSGRPFNWTNPKTQPMWGTYTLNTNREKYKKGVEDILKGKKK